MDPAYENVMVMGDYTARPTRIYFIGRDGRVLYNPGVGPSGFNPDHPEPVIRAHLATG